MPRYALVDATALQQVGSNMVIPDGTKVTEFETDEVVDIEAVGAAMEGGADKLAKGADGADPAPDPAPDPTPDPAPDPGAQPGSDAAGAPDIAKTIGDELTKALTPVTDRLDAIETGQKDERERLNKLEEAPGPRTGEPQRLEREAASPAEDTAEPMPLLAKVAAGKVLGKSATEVTPDDVLAAHEEVAAMQKSGQDVDLNSQEREALVLGKLHTSRPSE